MKRFRLLLLFTLISYISICKANDGVFYVAGNHLIPIIETRISIKKEILSVKKVGEYYFINVYYEMFNPDEKRKLEVGFEASSPGGDVSEIMPVNGRHPYITEFTANVNSIILDYKVAIVSDSDYYKNGIFQHITPDKYKNYDIEGTFNLRYVYHFNVEFKKGLNTIIHTYKIKASSSVENDYDLNYVLTAAMRWGNKQIDDFTLLIDVGEFQTIFIDKTFYNSVNEWLLIGKGKMVDNDTFLYKTSIGEFNIQQGTLMFNKKNFRTNGELLIQSFWPYIFNSFDVVDTFDYKKHKLVFQMNNPMLFAKDEMSLKLLKNLPFARRGYVFKNKDLQDYFEKMTWYRKDPSCEGNLSDLTEEEKQWLKQIKTL